MSEKNTLEQTIAEWHKNAPHLPTNSQKWLAVNLWWLALVGVILGALAVLGVMMFSLFASAALMALGGPVGVVAGGAIVASTLILLAFAIVSLVITGIAIPALKAGTKKGWRLLFIVMLINVVSLVLDLLLTFNVGQFIWSLILTALGAYLLFEVRSYFGVAKHEKVAKPVEKAA